LASLFDNGMEYIGFASYCDGPFVAHGYGWLLAHDASTLQQQSLFVSSPNGYGSGIWASGGGPSADVNHNIYFTTATVTLTLIRVELTMGTV
jgi:hypothetical protein